VEHLKRYTTTGMGTDQGKTSNINALILMGEYTSQAPSQVGTTRFRPPYAPVTLGMIAGRRVGALYRPLKRLPAHDWHAAHGALFETFGDWCRPAAYPRPGETLEAAAQREARTSESAPGSSMVRRSASSKCSGRTPRVFWISCTSAHIDAQDRPGALRLLLNENGTLVDDGIVARLSAQRYWVNTTTAGFDRTAAAFEEWLQCEYADFKVVITPVTSRWANITIAGPRAWSGSRSWDSRPRSPRRRCRT